VEEEMSKAAPSLTTDALIEMIQSSEPKALKERLPSRIVGLRFSGVIEQSVWKEDHMRVVAFLDGTEGRFKVIADFDQSLQKEDKKNLKKNKRIAFEGTVTSFGYNTLVVVDCRLV